MKKGKLRSPQEIQEDIELEKESQELARRYSSLSEQVRQQIQDLDGYRKMVASWSEQTLREELFRLKERWEDQHPSGRRVEDPFIFLSDTYQKLKILREAINKQTDNAVEARLEKAAAEIYHENHGFKGKQRTKGIFPLSTTMTVKYFPEVKRYTGRVIYGKKELTDEFKKFRDRIRKRAEKKLKTKKWD